MSERAFPIDDTFLSEAPAEPVAVLSGEADPDDPSKIAGASGRASGAACTPAVPEAFDNSPATEAGATVEARREFALDRAIFPLEHASFEGQPLLARWLA